VVASALVGLVWADAKRDIRDLRLAAKESVTKETLDTHLRQDAQTHAEIKLEQTNLREDIREIFKLLRQQSTDSYERHIELVNAINKGDHGK